MNAITVAQAKAQFEELLEQVVTDAEPVIVATESGKNIVILSLEEFNAWQETFYLLSPPANAEHLRKSIQEAETGNLVEKDVPVL